MKNISDIKLFVITSDYWIYWSGYKYDKGRILIRWWHPMKGWVVNLLASPTKRHYWGGKFRILLDDLLKHNHAKEIPLSTIHELKPHWNKELKSFIKEHGL